MSASNALRKLVAPAAMSLLALMLPASAAALTPFKVKGSNLVPEKYIGKFIDEKLNIVENQDDGLIKVVGYDKDLDEFIFRVNAAYYENITFDWVDEQNNTHTSKLTDRAETREHMYALLSFVYSDPRVPGFRRDISYINNPTGDEADYTQFVGKYVLENSGGLSTSPSRIYRSKTIGNKTYIKIYTDPEGNPIGPKEAENTQTVERSKFQELEYECADFYPYNLKDGDVKKPLNGATALIVEMTDDFYPTIEKRGDQEVEVLPVKTWDQFTNNKDFIDNIFKYIKAISVIPTQLYVNEEASNGNPGFIFNASATLSKCFLLTKGCNRAYKYYERQHPDKKGFYGGEPFYHMFEEYSADNTKAAVNAFNEMNTGRVFEVDHNCGTSIMQNHITAFAPTIEDTESYNVNLMLFVPDRRFNAETRIHPDHYELTDDYGTNLAYENKIQYGTDEIDGVEYPYYLVDASNFHRGNKTYTPYTFYAEGNRPYLYFNKIELGMKTAQLITKDGKAGKGTQDDPMLATVELDWTTNYNKVVGHNAPQQYQIFRLSHGNTEELPIPIEDIEILEESDTWMSGKYSDDIYRTKKLDKYTIRSYSDHIYVKVKEKVAASNGPDDKEAINRQGNEISYVVKGRRDGNEFHFTSSNNVIGHLPGNELSTRLVLAESKGIYWEGYNEYHNTIEFFYNGFDTDVSNGLKDVVEGNLSYKDLVTSASLFEGTEAFDRNKIEADLSKEIRVYRIKVVGDNKPMPIATYRFPKENGVVFFDYSVSEPNKAAIVATMEEWRYVYDDNGKLKYDENGKPVLEFVKGITDEGGNTYNGTGDGSYTTKKPFGPLQGKIEYSYLFEKDENGITTSKINGEKTWIPLAGNGTYGNMGDVLAKFDDELRSLAASADKFADRFRYYFVLVPIDSKLEVDDAHQTAPQDDEAHPVALADTESAADVVKVSNFTNVYVPKREIFAGFVPYSEEEVAADRNFNNLLELNKRGLAVNVQNNLNVVRYKIYAHDKNLTHTEQKDFKPVAEINRFPEGSFASSVYKYNVEEGSDKYTVSESYRTELDYKGRVLITDIDEQFITDHHEFTAEIHYYDDAGVYAKNTYILPSVSFPARPQLTVTNVELTKDEDNKMNIKEDGNGKYIYNVDLSMNVTNVKDFTINSADSYGIWSTEVGVTDPATSLLHHRGWEWAEVPSATEALSDDNNNAPIDADAVDHTVNVNFKHSLKATDKDFVMFVKSARVYAQLPDKYNISVNPDNTMSPATGYYVTDGERLFGVYGNGNLSGIEDVTVDACDDEYYNLQGVRVNPENAAPGVYIRRHGNTSEKVIIK